MEADAAGLEPELLGEHDEVDRHVRVAAEFARQRPIRRFTALGEDAAEDARPRSFAGDVAQVRLAVGGEEPDALFVAVTDVGGLLDRVAVAEAVGRHAERQHPVELIARGDVEARSQLGESAYHLRRRTGLDRVVNLGERHQPLELAILAADDLEIDEQKRRFVALRLFAEKPPLFGRIVLLEIDRHCPSNPHVLLLVASPEYRTDKKTESASTPPRRSLGFSRPGHKVSPLRSISTSET